MSFAFKTIILFNICFFTKVKQYNYILVCLPQNCAPCIKHADDFFAEDNLSYKLISLYSNKLEKTYIDNTIETFLTNSKNRTLKNVKNKYTFGKINFNSKDKGPFLIKYSNVDTIVYNSSTIFDLKND